MRRSGAARQKQLVAPDRAFNYLIDIVRGLCFSEYLGALEVPKLAELTFVWDKSRSP